MLHRYSMDYEQRLTSEMMAARAVPSAPHNYFIQFEVFLILFLHIFNICSSSLFYIALSILNSLYKYF